MSTFDVLKRQKDYLDIEKKYNLYHIEIDSVNIWQYFRTELWNEILVQNSGGVQEDPTRNKQGETNISKSIEIKIFLRKIGYILTHKNRTRIHTADVLFLNFGRKFFRNGVYIDKLTGELETCFRNNFVIIEFNRNYSMPLRPTQSQNEYYPELLGFITLLRARIELFFNMNEYKKARENVEKHFTAPLEEIKRTYDFKIDLQSYFHIMTMQILKIKRFRKSYRRLLDKVRPKVIFETIPNSRPSMIINEIAKEMKIPTIELQHAFPIHNLIWNYADGCGEIRQFPDYEFGYSDYFNSFMHLPIPAENIKAVGLPYLEQSLLAYPKCKKDNRVTILFISQGPHAKQLSKLAVEIRERLDVNQYRIIYKLHPDETSVWRERLPWLCKRDDVEVIDDRTYETYRCFAESDMQIGVNSTALFEGMAYDLDTYIYKAAYWEVMSDAINLGYASLITDCDDFITKINGSAITKEQSKDSLWKRNAIENMLREIELISGVRGKKHVEEFSGY